MTRIALVAGALLGVLSRIEETTAGLSLGISANSTWLAVAFLAGMAHRHATAPAGARAGALALTAANLAYYAWIAELEPGVDLAAVAGSPLRWLLLGASGGAVFAVAARPQAPAARRRVHRRRHPSPARRRAHRRRRPRAGCGTAGHLRDVPRTGCSAARSRRRRSRSR